MSPKERSSLVALVCSILGEETIELEKRIKAMALLMFESIPFVLYKDMAVAFTFTVPDDLFPYDLLTFIL